MATPAKTLPPAAPAARRRRYGMVIDLDRCTGCGACMTACAAENNVAPGPAAADERKAIQLIRVHTVREPNSRRTVFVPILCMQCGDKTPCVTVCPQQAVEVDPLTGIVEQMPQRCLGCRYCMAACPYQVRVFNWWDPAWPAGMEATLNPGVAPRMRGVAEKCDLCHARLHAAEDRAAQDGRRDLKPGEYVPACVEACPTQAIHFGDLADPESEVARLAGDPGTFRWLERLGTGPKISYRSRRRWVQEMARQGGAAPSSEVSHG